MSDVSVGAVVITGNHFDSQAQVLLDGSPVETTVVDDAQHVEGSVKIGLSLGVHQFSVQDDGQVSNSLPYTYYYPTAAPGQLFEAFAGYYAGPESGTNPAVVGDFNGDGLDDVVIESPAMNGTNEPTVALLLGQADGSLGAPQFLSNIQASVAGDVDGNGTIDLVALAIGNSGLGCSVYLNDGHANFTPGPACPTIANGNPIMWKLVDMNGDGLPDLIVGTQSTPNAIYLLLSQGGGRFAAPLLLAKAGSNQTFAVADWNGDGRPDIAYNAVGTTGADEVHLLLNQGSGKFQDTVPSGLQGAAGTLITADFNVDGFADLAIEFTVSSVPDITVRVFLGQGNNTFTQASETILSPEPFASYQFVAGDFDDDGFPDLVGQNAGTQPSYLLYLWGDGTGQFSQEAINGPQGSSLAIGDINGDGLPDIVVPDEFNEISVVLGRTDRNYASPVLLIPTAGPYVSIADVNGDGLPDILIGTSVSINQGNGTFASPVSVSASAWAMADINGDGLADLIGGAGDAVLVWPGTGNPTFPGSPITYTPPIPMAISELQIKDMDNDGHPDLVSSGIILYSDSQFNFTPVQVPFTVPYVIGDFNGDGFLDIATNGQTWLGGPNRTFTPVPNVFGLPDGNIAAVGDFNGDGNLDIATTGGIIWYGNGRGDFYQQGAFTADAPLGGIVVGDFNHDGLPDIAVGLQLPHQIAVFINDGQGGFQRSYYASGAATFGMASADFNQDGKIDLVVCNQVLVYAIPNALVIFGK
jgi:hypothetical protein